MGRIQRRREMDLILILTFAMLSLLVSGTVDAEKKITLGTIEEIILWPWGVKLLARIDTGAAKSSLDARELTVQDDMVQFKLPQKYGGLQLRLPIIEWRHIRTSPHGRYRNVCNRAVFKRPRLPREDPLPDVAHHGALGPDGGNILFDLVPLCAVRVFPLDRVLPSERADRRERQARNRTRQSGNRQRLKMSSRCVSSWQ